MFTRKEFFGGNWKMNKSFAEGKQFFTTSKNLNWNPNKETALFPPLHILIPLHYQFKDSFNLGSQNFYFEDNGAFTGEVSALMLKNEAIQYSIVGHSERRQIFKESDELINKKVTRGLNLNLKIIFCLGETLEQREKNKHFDIIKSQLNLGLKDVVLKHSEQIIIAYEPIWAIGTGKIATPEQAQEMHHYIRKELNKMALPSNEIRIIYGGSVKPENIKLIMKNEDIDGALVGGASLKPESFNRIVNYE